jgi:mono/diheme cytochrome c family protein
LRSIKVVRLNLRDPTTVPRRSSILWRGSALPALLAAMALAACASVPAHAPPTYRADVHAGRVLAAHYCAQCHAIGRSGPSPQAAAPPFRFLSERYPIESFEPRFASGMSTSHPDMPHWQLDPDQNRQMIAFLKSVQR